MVGNPKSLDQLKEYINPIMGQWGNDPAYIDLNNSEQLSEETKEEIKKKLKDIEIVVYCYDPKEKELEHKGNLITQDYIMRDLVELVGQDKEIPLIVYYPDRVKGQDFDKINKNNWTMLANKPATLLGHIYTYIHAIPPKKEG
jgi:hypothetical protein